MAEGVSFDESAFAWIAICIHNALRAVRKGHRVRRQAAVADRFSCKRCDCDQLSGPADAAGGDQCDPEGDSDFQRGVFAAEHGVSCHVRRDIRGRRKIGRCPWDTHGLHMHHDLLVAGVRESRARADHGHAGGEPAASRNGRGRRFSGGDARSRGMVFRGGTIIGDGHHQWRDGAGRHRGARADCRRSWVHKLAGDILPHGGAGLGMDVLLVADVFSA